MRRSVPARVAAAAVAAVLACAADAAAQSGIAVEWDRNPEPEVEGYIVYVGTAASEYAEWFDVGNATSFSYPDPVAGRRYFFAVAAYIEGRLEGPLSNEVNAETGPSESRERQRAPACSAGAPACSGAQALAENLGPISSIAALDTGSVVLLESDRVVRTISGDGRDVRASLLSSSEEVRFTALVPDPGFARTRFIYAGMIERSRSGEPEFSVVRYREMDGILGEGAVIVNGLRLATDDVPAFAVDDGGRIYVSMPGDGSRRDPYGARVLRFDARGAANGSGTSPILGDGYRRPSALVWDGTTLWRVGTGEGSSAMEIARVTAGDQEAPLREGLVQSAMAGARAIQAFAARAIGDRPGEGTVVAWLDDKGVLTRARVRDGASMERESIPLEPDVAVAVALGASGDVYAAVRRANGSFSLVRVPAQGGKF